MEAWTLWRNKLVAIAGSTAGPRDVDSIVTKSLIHTESLSRLTRLILPLESLE